MASTAGFRFHHQVAAGAVHVGACDEVGGGGGKEDGIAHEIAGLGQAADGLAVEEVLVHGGIGIEHPLGQLAAEHRGAEGVDVDAVFGGEVAGQAVDHQVRAALAGAVAGVARHAALGALGGDDDHLAALPLLHHLVGDVLHDDVDALAVGVHDVLPVGDGLIQHVLGLVVAVGDGQDVDLAVLVHAGLDDRLDVLLLGGIADGEGAVDALGLELVLKGLELFLVAAGHEDLAAGIAVSLGQHAAQRAGGAGDEGDLALDGEHVLNKTFFYGYHASNLLIRRPDS